MDRRFFHRWILIFFLLSTLLFSADDRRADPIDRNYIVDGWAIQRGIFCLNWNIPSEGPSPGSIWTLTENIAYEHGISPKLIKSIILTESNGDPRKISPKGAKGLMQLMPVVTEEFKVLDPLDPGSNIRAGVQYLKSLLLEFSGDLHLALAAYNAGPGAVRKYHGIPPFPETQAFVRNVSHIFHFGDDSRSFHPESKMGGTEALTRIPGKILIGGSPKNVTLFLKKNRPESEEQEQP